MSYKLFLDDYRNPIDCVGYMHSRIGVKNPLYLDKDWIIIKDYNSFINYITKNGLPNLISFDHDLADEHYCPEEFWEDYYTWHNEQEFNEKTGYDCAKWLLEYCKENQLNIPEYFVHSMNPVGTENILNLLK